MVEPRTVRAYWTQFDAAMARISTASAALPPCDSCGRTARSTPSISSAMRMAGNESWTSATRMMKASSRPPTKPAMSPSATPTTTASATDATPTSSETRAPYMIAESTSRPWSSVPSRWPALRAQLPGRRRERVEQVERGEVEGIGRREPGREHRGDDADREHDRRDDRHRRAAEAVGDVAVPGAERARADDRRLRDRDFRRDAVAAVAHVESPFSACSAVARAWPTSIAFQSGRST